MADHLVDMRANQKVTKMVGLSVIASVVVKILDNHKVGALLTTQTVSLHKEHMNVLTQAKSCQRLHDIKPCHNLRCFLHLALQRAIIILIAVPMWELLLTALVVVMPNLIEVAQNPIALIEVVGVVANLKSKSALKLL
jgi:hypothetical protein